MTYFSGSKNNSYEVFYRVIFGLIVVLMPVLAWAAWSEPDGDPTGNNAPAPINVSTDPQTKGTVSPPLGDLTVGGFLQGGLLHSLGDLIVDRYLTVAGDGANPPADGKVLTAVDATGLASWQTPVVGSNYWTSSLPNIYNNNPGYVGIGTSAPTTNLHVNGAGLFSSGLNVGDTTNAPLAGGLRFARAGSSDPFLVFSNNSGSSALAQIRGANGGGLYFTNGGSGVEWARFTAAGNLGIGAPNPTSKLEVVGSARISSNLAVGPVSVNGAVTTNGGVVYTTGTKPGCTSSARGATWFTQGASGVKDSFEVCAKDAANSYAWRVLY